MRPIPTDMEEQKEIAQLLTGLNKKIGLAKQKITQLQDLFPTLLHEPMSAKIRIHDIAPPVLGLELPTSESA